MAFRIKMKRYSSRATVVGTDEVFAWFPIPKDGVWMGATFDLHVVSLAKMLISDNAKLYGISGYFIPVNDLTALPTTPDLFWDTQIVKDTAVAEDALDLDHTSVAAADVTQGLPNLALMTDAHTGPIKLFRTERLMSFANSGRTMVTTVGSETYMPIDRVRMRTRKQVRAKSRPGVVLLAISVGNFDIPETFTGGSANAWAPGQSEDGVTVAEFEWRVLKYMQKWMEDAATFLMPGAVEAGAQEPYEKAAEVAGRIVEQGIEDTDAQWDITTGIHSFAITTGSMIVPGRPMMKTLKGN